MKRTLCQDCLRAPKHVTNAEFLDAHQERVFCVCGGQLCGCDNCVVIVAKLEQGGTGNLDGELLVKVKSWNAEDGAVLQEEK